MEWYKKVAEELLVERILREELKEEPLTVDEMVDIIVKHAPVKNRPVQAGDVYKTPNGELFTVGYCGDKWVDVEVVYPDSRAIDFKVAPLIMFRAWIAEAELIAENVQSGEDKGEEVNVD